MNAYGKYRILGLSVLLIWFAALFYDPFSLGVWMDRTYGMPGIIVWSLFWGIIATVIVRLVYVRLGKRQ